MERNLRTLSANIDLTLVVDGYEKENKFVPTILRLALPNGSKCWCLLQELLEIPSDSYLSMYAQEGMPMDEALALAYNSKFRQITPELAFELIKNIPTRLLHTGIEAQALKETYGIVPHTVLKVDSGLHKLTYDLKTHSVELGLQPGNELNQMLGSFKKKLLDFQLRFNLEVRSTKHWKEFLAEWGTL